MRCFLGIGKSALSRDHAFEVAGAGGQPFECLLSARRAWTRYCYARAQVYERARQANPLRWSRQVRDGTYVDTVHLNRDTPQNKEPQTIQKAA
jgi:hypothetical protein